LNACLGFWLIKMSVDENVNLIGTLNVDNIYIPINSNIY